MNSKAPLNSQFVAKAAPNLSHLTLDSGNIYWLQSQPENKGRLALMEYAEGRVEEVLDESFSVRTRVHEYGGGAYTVRNQTIVFCNEHDQALYLKNPHHAPIPITSVNAAYRYADMQISPDNKWLVCIRESNAENKKNITELVSIDLQKPFHLHILHSGHDFYAAPRINADGKKLCWLSWDHPHMPWDQSRLSIAKITTNGRLQAITDLAYPDNSFLQPQWGRDNQLYFMSDHQGWWNIYCLQQGEITAITQTKFDHAKPPWILGLSNYALVTNKQMVCSYTNDGSWTLCQIDLDSLQTKTITRQFAEIAHIQSSNNQTYFIASTANSPQTIQQLNHATGDFTPLSAKQSHCTETTSIYTEAEPFSFNNATGETVHALYYAPNASEVKPALLVMAHGGPTSQFETTLDLKIQYWVSQGFAVCAVNYSGSSGYGREYRNRLKYQWGIADVDDCIGAAQYLIHTGEVDANKIAIKGSSAGGYTVLRALSNTHFFSAGASHYGISDLTLLRQQTHKFESLYIDWLIGPYAKYASTFRERSPIQQTQQWKTPILFLQGGKDKIVPPNQATKLHETLTQQHVDTELVIFADEGHGFRQEKNIAAALEHELDFYQRLW